MTDSAYSDEWQMKWYELEDKSWWYKYRKWIFLFLARRYLKKEDDLCDIGGSNGYYTIYFQKRGYRVSLLEPTKQACTNAKNRGVLRVINSSLEEYSDSISNFLLLDVLEHIEDDRSFLKMIGERANESCRGIISVPAYNILWSKSDEDDGHFRRYKKNTLIKVIEESGFRVMYINYIFGFLWLPIFVKRHLPYIICRNGKTSRTRMSEDVETRREFVIDGILNRVVWNLLRNEYKRIVRGNKLPFGSSIICVIEKENLNNGIVA